MSMDKLLDAFEEYVASPEFLTLANGAKPTLLIRHSFYSGWFDAASVIEARSGETGTGSTEGESATRQGDAQ